MFSASETSFKLSAESLRRVTSDTESLPILSHLPSGDIGCPGPPIYFTDLEVRVMRKVSTSVSTVSKLIDAVPSIQLHLSGSKQRYAYE